MGSIVEMTGKRFGRLTVIGRDHVSKCGIIVWKCRCDCGNETASFGTGLRNGTTCSCGCLRNERVSQATSGELNHKWKGGRKISKRGYIQIIRTTNPCSHIDGYILEHRAVMEQMIGRPLKTHEIVHHCNGDKTDNRPFNLQLFSSQKEHMKRHRSLI